MQAPAGARLEIIPAIARLTLLLLQVTAHVVSLPLHR